MNDSLDFYSENARDFFKRTVELDLSVLYAEFLPHIPEGGAILDAGCGSGRDSRHFLENGFAVHAFDAAPDLAERASKYIEQRVEVVDFASFKSTQQYDGIWACASLLHTAPADLPAVIENLASFMKTGGVFYMSFKYGTGETARGNRRFTDMDEAGIDSLARALASLRLKKSWATQDLRVKRVGEKWMNTLWMK